MMLLDKKQIWECTKCQFDERKDARYCGGVGDDCRAIFIAESPSTAGGTGKRRGCDGFYWGPNHTADDRLFRKVRETYGLENCYTTDFVKCGVAAGKPTKEKINNCLPFLKKEIEMIGPRVIVAVGKHIEIEGKHYLFSKILQDLVNPSLPIITTWHYSYVWNKCQVKKSERDHPDVPKIKNETMVAYLNQHKEILTHI